MSDFYAKYVQFVVGCDDCNAVVAVVNAAGATARVIFLVLVLVSVVSGVVSAVFDAVDAVLMAVLVVVAGTS